MYGLITQREAATQLRVSVRTIQRWAQAGELPAPIKIGRNAYYRAATVRDFIEIKINGDQLANGKRRNLSSQ